VRAGDPAQMAAAGAVDAACAAYASQGAYDKVFELASRANASTLAQYIYPHAEQLLANGKPGEVAALLARYGAPPVATQLQFYARLVADSMATGLPQAGLADLRDVLYKVVAGLRKQQSGGAAAAGAGGGSNDAAAAAAALPDFERVLLAIHYVAMRARLAEMGLPELAARAAVSALRFAGSLLPADRVFFDAGLACRAAGWKSMALVLLNRFIDLCDAIEEGARDASGLDDGDFVGAGLPAPSDMRLPRTCTVPERAREEAKEWVLTVSMDRKVEQSLARRPCLACGAQIFEGALACPACHAQFPSDVVTGYPVASSQLISCGSCGSRAAKAAWNAFASKTKSCAWCSASANTAL
jgi:intraflagellar transport protein 172